MGSRPGHTPPGDERSCGAPHWPSQRGLEPVQATFSPSQLECRGSALPQVLARAELGCGQEPRQAPAQSSRPAGEETLREFTQRRCPVGLKDPPGIPACAEVRAASVWLRSPGLNFPSPSHEFSSWQNNASGASSRIFLPGPSAAQRPAPAASPKAARSSSRQGRAASQLNPQTDAEHADHATGPATTPRRPPPLPVVAVFCRRLP